MSFFLALPSDLLRTDCRNHARGMHIYRLLSNRELLAVEDCLCFIRGRCWYFFEAKGKGASENDTKQHHQQQQHSHQQHQHISVSFRGGKIKRVPNIRSSVLCCAHFVADSVPLFSSSLLAGGSCVYAVRDPDVQRQQSPSTVPEDRRVRQVLQPFPVRDGDAIILIYSSTV